MGDIRPSGVADPEARAALVWILGHFGQHIDSEYVLGLSLTWLLHCAQLGTEARAALVCIWRHLRQHIDNEC
jgi:hypothetical protein